MLNTILWKRLAQALAIIMVLSVFLTATIALAVVAQKPIKADTGGTIVIDDGIELIIPPDALKRNTHIRVKMVRNKNKTTFEFKPHGLVFNKPIQLWATKEAIGDSDVYILYFAPNSDNPDDYTEVIYPNIYDAGVTWDLEHFSLYYYRRR